MERNWRIWYFTDYITGKFTWYPDRTYKIKSYADKHARWLANLGIYREVIVLPYGQDP